MSRGILLVGHGSRQAAGNAQFLALAAAVAARSPEYAWEPCFLDHAEPGIQAGVDRLVARGCGEIAVVPVFLFAAGHAKRDVPQQLAAALARHPAVRFRCGRPLGVDPGLVAICAEAVSAAQTPAAETAVLLVGRGSSDPEANAGLAEVARLLQAATGLAAVVPAYCDVAAPTVPEGMVACVATGVRHVVLLPYFLFQGVLMDRMQALVAEWQARHPDRSIRMTGENGLGAWPAVAELVWRRAAWTISVAQAGDRA